MNSLFRFNLKLEAWFVYSLKSDLIFIHVVCLGVLSKSCHFDCYYLKHFFIDKTGVKTFGSFSYHEISVSLFTHIRKIILVLT